MTTTQFIRTFGYGSSIRTLYKLDAPLSNRIPLRDHVLKIERDEGKSVSWLAAYPSGEIMCFHPICAADMARIEAGLSAEAA